MLSAPVTSDFTVAVVKGPSNTPKSGPGSQQPERSPYVGEQAPWATTLGNYSIRSKIWNIGRYNAMTMPPTIPPITAIISGSIKDVNESVVDAISTS